MVNQPTRGKNILDLILCSHPNLVPDLEIVPGLSDHEAIYFSFNLLMNMFPQDASHHKANLDHLKTEILNFKKENEGHLERVEMEIRNEK